MFLFGSSPFSTTSTPTYETNPLQKIYDQLESISNFSSSVNNPLYCPNIKSVLDTMKLVALCDLGISHEQVTSMSRNSCSTILEVAGRYEIAVFHLSAGRSLPVHDHPNMAVLSRVVCGDLAIRSYSADPADSGRSQNPSAGPGSRPRAARGFESDPSRSSKESSPFSHSVSAVMREESRRGAADDAWFLSPTEGNYHEFTALSNCVVLDVLLPPYSESEDRRCTYYSVGRHPIDPARVLLTPRTDDPFADPGDVPLLVPYTGFMPRRRILPRFKATY